MRGIRGPILAGLSSLSVGLAACGSGAPPPSPTPSPPAGCAQATASGPGARLDAAALLTMTITVATGGAAAPRCVPGRPGEAVTLRVGDEVQLIANTLPQLTPAATRVVRVSTAAGPVSTGPGGIATSHLLVTLTAEHAGRVSVTWTDCSGTGC